MCAGILSRVLSVGYVSYKLDLDGPGSSRLAKSPLHLWGDLSNGEKELKCTDRVRIVIQTALDLKGG